MEFITGEFEFRFYVDSVRDVAATETRDVSLAGSKTITYTVKGKPGEEKYFAIKVMSTKTGREGVYLEMKIKFCEGDEKPEKEEVSKNSAVFRQLLKEEEPSEPDSSSSSDSGTSLV